MEVFKIDGQRVTFYAKSKGANTNKFNRVNKLAAMYNDLDKKLRGMADRGMKSNTSQYRCAVATLLLLHTGIRIGNESSAEGYNTVPHPHAKDQESKFVQTYGLTTLLREHLKERKIKQLGAPSFYLWEFQFVGKKQVQNNFIIPANLQKYITTISKEAGNTLFGITDYELTKFIKKYVGKQFTPKDFRTLRANIYAYNFLVENIPECGPGVTKKIKKEYAKAICEHVAEKLNNTPGVCKKSYINELLFIEELNL